MSPFQLSVKTIPGRFRKEALLFLTLLLCLTAGTDGLHANMRMAYNRTHYNAGILHASRIDSLVQREILKVTCDPPYEGDVNAVMEERRFCDVEATYFLEEKNGIKIDLEFILPGPGTITYNVLPLKVGGTVKATPVDSTAYAGFLDPPFESFSGGKAKDSLHGARFRVQLVSGSNQIRVAYRVPLGVTETSHGYFTESTWSSGIGYELWPLKEWRLADGFTLELFVRVKNRRTGWLASLLPGGASIELTGGNQDNHSVPDSLSFRSKHCGRSPEFSHCRYLFGKTFPDRLNISFD